MFDFLLTDITTAFPYELIRDEEPEAALEVARQLEFFMGKNTPERREFVVDNLRIEAAR